jgi:hypothetical protein
LLGLGDPSKPVRGFIEKAQAPVNKAIDWVINLAVKGVKAAGNLVKGLFRRKGKDGKPVHEEDPEKGAKLEAGLVAIDREDKARLKDGTLEEGTVREPFSMGTEGHTLTATARGGQLRITIATTEMLLQSALDRAITQVKADELFPNRKAILKRLEQALVLADYNTIIEQWHAEQRPGRFPDFLKRRVLKIIAQLSDLGGLGIHGLDELFGRMKRGNGPYSHLPDTEKVGEREPFTLTQRTLILTENRRIHKVAEPFAVSDLSQVLLDDSLVPNDPRKPNIDHIFPRTEGGLNSYSNARVLARDENAAKGAKITHPLPFELPEERPSAPTVIRRRKPQSSGQ